MNWDAWTPALIALAGVIANYGQLKGRIQGQEKTLVRHDGEIKEHGRKLSAHDIELAEARGWRKGYEAAKPKQNFQAQND